MTAQIAMKPGAFVVLEGLDATGKSTQNLRLNKAAHGQLPGGEGHHLFKEPPHFTRQPAGTDELGKEIYALTESDHEMTAWTRQFLHLASHANHYQNSIIPILRSGRSVFMDRCWWSTFAYGFWGTAIQETMEPEEFLSIAQLPTQGWLPDLVLLFMEPYHIDRHNTPSVVAGYEWLEDYVGGDTKFGPSTVKRIYAGTPEQVSLEIIIGLCDAGLADPVG